ncbi:MAG: helix-turn-helix transcriptional regulator [Phycisphaerales bacterium]|nr:helix-turn-helix transcriptional regulator [Phycisphaerales bacterium]
MGFESSERDLRSGDRFPASPRAAMRIGTVMHGSPSPNFIAGSCVRTRQAGLFTLTERTYGSCTIGRHAHNCSSLDVVLDGVVRDRYRHRERVATPGTLLFYGADVKHEWQSDGVVIFHIMLPQTESRLFENEDPESRIAPAIAHRLYQEFRARDDASSLAVESLGYEMVAQSQPIERGEPKWCRVARSIMHDLSERSIRLEWLASEVGVHPGHLARTFRRFHGCTPGEYLRRVRVTRAAMRLRDPDLPIATIAADAGFSDQAHFSREFRTHVGTTPSSYRRTVAG